VIRIINGIDDARHRPLLDAMFTDRKRLFVDLLGWDVPVVDGRYEIDQFDGAHATYVVEANASGGHAGSLRLLPTDRPHILGSLFADLCPGGVPNGPDTYEITRLCLPVRHLAPERLRIRNRLISGIVDHALATGIAAFTGVVAEPFRRQVLAMGWRAEALGPALAFGGARLGAFRIHVERDTPVRLAATGIYTAGMRVIEEGRAVA